MPTFGITFKPSGDAALLVEDVVISDCDYGITVAPDSGTATISIERTTIANGFDRGLYLYAATGNVKGTLTSSTITGYGAGVMTSSGDPTLTSLTLTIDDSHIVNNMNGLVADGPPGRGGMIVGRSVINNNNNGLAITGGAIYSYGDNALNANRLNDGLFTATIPRR